MRIGLSSQNLKISLDRGKGSCGSPLTHGRWTSHQPEEKPSAIALTHHQVTVFLKLIWFYSTLTCFCIWDHIFTERWMDNHMIAVKQQIKRLALSLPMIIIIQKWCDHTPKCHTKKVNRFLNQRELVTIIGKWLTSLLETPLKFWISYVESNWGGNTDTIAVRSQQETTLKFGWNHSKI